MSKEKYDEKIYKNDGNEKQTIKFYIKIFIDV